MATLRKTNGGGASQCSDANAENQQKCDNYDGRHRSDNAQTCFCFRDYGHGFWICDAVISPLTT